MFLSAHITANVEKRQVSVLKSKYPRYSESGFTIKQEMSASVEAMHKTKFVFANLVAATAHFVIISRTYNL